MTIGWQHCDFITRERGRSDNIYRRVRVYETCSLARWYLPDIVLIHMAADGDGQIGLFVYFMNQVDI